MNTNTSFIQFTPLLKSTLWGGGKIIPFKRLDCTLKDVGESWEISGVEGCQTYAANGPWKGRPLNEMVRLMKEKLVGRINYQRFGDEFPLLIKFIDAQQNLSIQVHPDNDTALKQGKPHGKTEMWYVVQTDPGAFLYTGLKQKLSPEQYRQMVAEDTICDALARYDVSPGDVFFLPGGRIHAIGAGTFLVEIQETSDITYRIYDFKRRDKNGNYRELHTELAAQSINYRVESDYQSHYAQQPGSPVQLVKCPCFTTTLYDMLSPLEQDHISECTLHPSSLDSFVILIAIKGSATLTDNEGNFIQLTQGETILIPAETDSVTIQGSILLLETHI